MSTTAGSRTVGVDLATEPDRTAAAVIRWDRDRAVLEEIVQPCGDERIAELVRLGRTGLDCALGWPVAFTDFLDALRDGTDPVVAPEDAAAWRRSLSMRVTDLRVTERIRHRPLSVSTDRLGLVAIRTASILARLRADGLDVRRDGTGRTVEVYPAAALRLWSIPSAGYKRDAAVRAEVVDALLVRMPWLDAAELVPDLVRTDHALDAFLAALCTRAVELDRVERPAPGETETALREGWILLPTCGPEDLLASSDAHAPVAD